MFRIVGSKIDMKLELNALTFSDQTPEWTLVIMAQYRIKVKNETFQTSELIGYDKIKILALFYEWIWMPFRNFMHILKHFSYDSLLRFYKAPSSGQKL